jgi:hypothetical protein
MVVQEGEFNADRGDLASCSVLVCAKTDVAPPQLTKIGDMASESQLPRVAAASARTVDFILPDSAKKRRATQNKITNSILLK